MEDTHQKVRYLFSILGLVLAGNVYGQAILPLDPNGPCAEGYNMYYFDLDGDGYGNPNMPVCDTSKPSNAVHNKRDCDDTDSSIYPGAPEITDGKDNNCDGVVDNGLPPAIPSPIECHAPVWFHHPDPGHASLRGNLVLAEQCLRHQHRPKSQQHHQNLRRSVLFTSPA